jgi:HEAT repeat protein
MARESLFLYRGKDIGGRDKMADVCLELIGRGDPEDIYDILPHIRVLRSPRFFQPLVELLGSGDPAQKAAAAAGLGSLGDPAAVPLLLDWGRRTGSTRSREVDPVRAAVICALGEIPCPASVEALREICDRLEGGAAHAPCMNLVVAALGELAQQGLVEAERELGRFLDDSQPVLRALAVTELSFAYWHRPSSIPPELLQRIHRMQADESEEARTAATAALHSLARLGCTAAGSLLRRQS